MAPNMNRGRIITNGDLSQNNYRGFLPQIVKTKDALKYFLDNYVEKDYVDPDFKTAFLVNNEYSVEVSYFLVYRLAWDSTVTWDTKSSSSERVGDYILTTTTTTRHTRGRKSGTTLSADGGDWVSRLNVEDFDDNDVKGLGSVQGLDIRFFCAQYEGGADYVVPRTQKELGDAALAKAKEDDKGKSVSITWRDLVVLVPILTIYRNSDNQTIFAMNLYNSRVGLDDVPVVKEMNDKLVVFKRVGTAVKWTNVLFWSLSIILPIVRQKFHFLHGLFAALLFIFLLVANLSTGSNKEDIRARLIKKPKGNFFTIQLGLVICSAVLLILAIVCGSLTFNF